MTDSTTPGPGLETETVETETKENNTKKSTETVLTDSDDSPDPNTNDIENVGASTSSFNPELQDEDLEKMKGDRIGDTLYSERFVLSTLLKLTKLQKNLKEDDEFEKDLCNLWDMTIEKDVVKLLLEHKVLEIFSTMITETNDKRLTEILVGIIGNMCALSEARDELCLNANIIMPIIDLISCSDSLTLIQLMRFFNSALVFENSGDEITWFEHFRNSDNFVDNFAFILNNSMSHTLLINAMEALNAICAKFAVIEIQPNENNLSFRELFVRPNLISGLVEAFKTLIPIENNKNNTDRNDSITPSKNTNKIMNLFLDVNVILSQYEAISKESYQVILPDFMKCVAKIISPLCEPINLLPLTINEQGIIENLYELFQSLGDPFHSLCYAQMITIWNLIDINHEEKEIALNSGGDFECDELDVDQINSEDICMTILEFLTRTVENATEHELNETLKLHNPTTIRRLLSALNVNGYAEEIAESFHKIKTACENIGIANQANQ